MVIYLRIKLFLFCFFCPKVKEDKTIKIGFSPGVHDFFSGEVQQETYQQAILLEETKAC